MNIKKISQVQPESFEFSKDNFLEAEKEIKKYPKDRKASAILALLFLVQNKMIIGYHLQLLSMWLSF